MPKSNRRLVASFVLLVLSLSSSPTALARQTRNVAPPQAAGQQPQQREQPQPLRLLQYRSIGPARGGRVTAVAGVPSQPMVYYFGATGGGVWKTSDGGANWEPITDGTVFGTGSVGAIGVSESDPNVVYVGMGESPIRGNVSHGDGVYKSMDAGRTWRRVGLEDTRHIGRVRVHPKNPDVVFVAALGHIFGPNEQRGVFRSRDGGRTWDKVLYRGDKAGAVDLVIDPTNPNVLYAGFWEVYRKPWTLESGGPGSGLFKSTDGGDTWTEITRNPGGPRGLVGKVGITVSPANPERVWAIVEAEDGGVFRSDNGGRTWARTNEQRALRQRAWYYTRIYADTENADTVYVLNVAFYKSNDGGRTFSTISVPHSDNHDLWIAPADNQRMVNGNDGGANVSFNGGRTWTEQDQSTAQFYRVAIDDDFPYHVYGAQQDNSTVKIASRTSDFAITERDWYDVGGGESGWIAPSPKDSNVVFAGSYGGLLTRYDHRSGQLRNVTVWPDNPMGAGAEAMRSRFQWNFPIVFSPHDQNTLYAAGSNVFKTTNEGQSWQQISPDLTRNDRSKQGPSGGPITKDNTSVEYYDTIFTLMESPARTGVIWAGSDDGLVHVTQNGGAKWDNVTPRGMPEWIQINSIDASPHDAATAYVAATMYKWDDFRPYLYKTSDFGRTWKKITAGIPDTAFTRVIREDPNRRGLLYAGTETGIYVSFNDGETWQSLQLNLPVVPITDLAVHKREKDLIVATQGRSFYILDDLPVLHQLADAGGQLAALPEAKLFKPEDAYRMQGGGFGGGGGGGGLPPGAPIGANPPGGVVVYYFLKQRPTTDVTLEFLDSAGKLIQKYTARAPQPQPTPAPGSAPVQRPPEQPQAPSGEESQFFSPGGGAAGAGGPRVSTAPGLNRFVWNMRHPEAVGFPGLIMWAASTQGPRAAPGTYTVRLTAGGRTLSETFEIKKDPRVETTAADFAKQLDLLLKIRDKVTETHQAILQIRQVRAQLEELQKRVQGQASFQRVADAAKSLNQKITAVEETLYQTKNQSSQDPLNYPIRLNNKLAALGGVVGSADAAPTEQSHAVYQELTAAIDAQLRQLDQVLKTDLPAFNRLVRDADIPAVVVRPPAGQ
jgi:photosystem II stability/assembly factor-like uncharacterized protein